MNEPTRECSTGNPTSQFIGAPGRTLVSWLLQVRVAAFFFLCSAVLAISGCRPLSRADLVVINSKEPESIDPHLSVGQPDGRVAAALFEGLTRMNPVTGEWEYGLAQSHVISQDLRTYTFLLRTNAAWSTGESITSEDFVWSWRRAVDPMTAADYASMLFFVQNGEAIHNGAIKDTSKLGIRAIDPRTVEVTLAQPTPFFLNLCAYRITSVVPRHLITRLGARADQWIRQTPLPCSGAYELVSWRINDRIRIRRNPRYWDASNVHLETIDLLPTESATASLNLYLTGAADLIIDNQSIPNDLNDALRTRPDFHPFSFLGTYFFRFNTTRPPFQDPRVRRALAQAVDKRRIVERITRMGEPVTGSMTPPGTGGYTPPGGLAFDPVAARRELEAAGFPGGRGFPRFQYMVNGGGGSSARIHEQIAVELQHMFREHLGIEMEIRPIEWKTFLREQSSLNFDLSRSSWIGDYNDPNTFLELFLSSNGNNRTGWKNTEYDRLLNTANRTSDPEKRRDWLRQAETLLVHQELPIVPIFHYLGMMAYDPQKWGGIHTNLTDEHPLWSVYRKKP